MKLNKHKQTSKSDWMYEFLNYKVEKIWKIEKSEDLLKFIIFNKGWELSGVTLKFKYDKRRSQGEYHPPSPSKENFFILPGFFEAT